MKESDEGKDEVVNANKKKAKKADQQGGGKK